MPSGRVRRMRKMALVAARDAANSLPSPVAPVTAPTKSVATTIVPEPVKPKLDQIPDKVKAYKKTNVKKDN